jgi:hypothetical protein
MDSSVNKRTTDGGRKVTRTPFVTESPRCGKSSDARFGSATLTSATPAVLAAGVEPWGTRRQRATRRPAAGLVRCRFPCPTAAMAWLIRLAAETVAAAAGGTSHGLLLAGIAGRCTSPRPSRWPRSASLQHGGGRRVWPGGRVARLMALPGRWAGGRWAAPQKPDPMG